MQNGQIYNDSWRFRPPSDNSEYNTYTENGKIIELSNTINQQDLIDISNTGIDSFSRDQGTYTKIDHNLSHKTNLIKFKIIKIVWSVFSNHNGIKLKINNINIAEKSPEAQKQKNIILNILCV